MTNTPPQSGDFPNRVTLELTNRCNLSCTFCPRCHMEPERGFLDTGLAKRLLKEMSLHAPVAVVPFFRGESLLHAEWFEIMAYARELNFGEIQLTTNASLLDPKNADKILDLELPFISFSLDTVDAELYNHARRGANFEVTTKNVLTFLEMANKRNSPTEVQVSAVETEAHKPGMQAFVDFWQPKVNRVRVYTEHSGDGNPGSINEELPDFESRKPCFKPFNDMIIYWNGQVAVCNHDWNRIVNGTPLGDVNETTIRDIWCSPAYETIRRQHMEAGLDGVSPCENCDHWKMYYMPSGVMGKTHFGGRRIGGK